MKTRRFISALLSLLLLATLLASTAQAALLDLGPIVPAVQGSTPPNLGHGFPSWYRDTRRVPLQLCVEEVPGCLPFEKPNPNQPVRYPDNMPDEIMYWSAQADMTTSGGAALLFAGIEANFGFDQEGNPERVSFARIRIRIDTTVAGDYRVITPFKVFEFNDVPVGVRAINYTEDIGLGANNVFTGALSGNIGPFLYSAGAPFVTATGSYLGDNTPRPVLGSGFTDPLTGQPANVFRIEGPPGFTTASTNLFAVTGKLFEDVTSTPLEIGKVTYTRSAAGVQVNAFATSEALSNQTNPAAPFPLRFALTGALTALQLAGEELPTLNMATNAPADGKFFAASAVFPDPGNLPAQVTVTNTADIPPVVKQAPLVDEVVIDSAMYNQANKTLIVSAKSYDAVRNPDLNLFLPGMTEPLGKLVNGKLSVTFPVTDTKVNPAKTYNNPPERVSVVSDLGGSDTQGVTGLSPFVARPTGTILINGGAAYASSAQVTLTLTATSPNGPVTEMQFSRDGVNFFPREQFAGTRSATLTTGDGAKNLYVRYIDATGSVSTPIQASIFRDSVRPTGSVTINGGDASTINSLVQLSLSANDDRSLVSMQFSTDGSNFFAPVPYASNATLNLFPGAGVRSVTVRFLDAAGNASLPASDSITVGALASGSVVINGGATTTNSATVNLTLTAGGVTGTVTHMQFSKDGVNYFPFENFAPSRTVTLLPGDGERFVYVRYKDNQGNVSAPFSASIVKDSTKPTGTIAITTSDPTTSATATLALAASDANGVTQMQFSKNGGAFFPLEAFAETRNVSLVPGLNTITVRYRDAAGNLSDPVSATITRN